MSKYSEWLEQLRNKEIDKLEVPKEEFLAFREVLVRDPHFKHFRGEAQQGGAIIFTFLEIPRS